MTTLHVYEAPANGPARASAYKYLRRSGGLYLFEDTSTGALELFARHKSRPACWHLIRGFSFYEFVTSDWARALAVPS